MPNFCGKDKIKNWSQTAEELIVNLLHEIENENGFVVKADLK